MKNCKRLATMALSALTICAVFASPAEAQDIQQWAPQLCVLPSESVAPAIFPLNPEAFMAAVDAQVQLLPPGMAQDYDPYNGHWFFNTKKFYGCAAIGCGIAAAVGLAFSVGSGGATAAAVAPACTTVMLVCAAQQIVPIDKLDERP